MDSTNFLRSYLNQQFGLLGFDHKLIFLALLLASSFFLLIKHATGTGRPKRAGRWPRLPPGPPGLPLIGNLHQAGKALHLDFLEVAKVYGPLFYFRAGCKPAVVVSSADTAREVLKIKDLATCSRPRLATAIKHTYGYLNLAFSPYNDYWRQMRRLLMSELFAAKKVLSMRSVREDEVGAFVDVINGFGSNTVDLSEMFFNLLNNLTVGTVFGKRYVKGWNGGRNPSLELVIEALELVVTFSMTDWIPWLGWVDKLRGIPEKIDRSFRRMDAFFEEVIETHLSDRAKNKHDVQNQHNDLTDIMLDIGQKLTIPLTKNHIKGILLVRVYIL